MTAAEQEFLFSLLTENQLEGTHLEVGTAAGGTLCGMMKRYKDHHRPPFMVVDRMTYFPNQFEIIKQNLSKHGLDHRQIDFRMTTSRRAFSKSQAAGEQFDFILIDASHKVVAVTADLCWTRLLRVGGIVCLHDYVAKFPGVKLSVNRFLASSPNYEVIGQVDSLIAIRKVSESRRPEVTTVDQAYSYLLHFPLAIRRKALRWKAKRTLAAKAA